MRRAFVTWAAARGSEPEASRADAGAATAKSASSVVEATAEDERAARRAELSGVEQEPTLLELLDDLLRLPDA